MPSLDRELAVAAVNARADQPVAELAARGPEGATAHALAVRRMFDRISPTYDLLNRLLSAGTDRRWRVRALDVLAACAPDGPLLDSCAGTLDLAEGIARRWPGRALVAGDFARAMLVAGGGKVQRGSAHDRSDSAAARSEGGGGPLLAVLDAMRLPFPADTFAGMTCGFGMRNLADPARGVAEAQRVLVPGGVFVVLEFFRPTRATTRLFHTVYARGVLPLVGKLVSGDGEAYAYLSRSMRGFLTRAEFEQALRAAGFREVGAVDLTFGIASLVWGIK